MLYRRAVHPHPDPLSRERECTSVVATSRTLLILLRLARDPLEQFLDLAVLLALAVGPFADHLLFGAHMRQQTLNGGGEIGARGGGAAAGAAFFQSGPQPLDRGLKLAARAGGALAGIFLHRGGEPVFEVGVD